MDILSLVCVLTASSAEFNADRVQERTQLLMLGLPARHLSPHWEPEYTQHKWVLPP